MFTILKDLSNSSLRTFETQLPTYFIILSGYPGDVISVYRVYPCKHFANNFLATVTQQKKDLI